MNVVFLDFDGVVNIPYWSYDETDKLVCRFNSSSDGKVNNFQACQWVSEFCERYDYKIVVSSIWRNFDDNYAKYLYNGGLRKNIEVIGRTPYGDKQRGDEITEWLSKHPEVENYLIFDDDSDMTIHMDRLVKCDSYVGFTLRELNKAEEIHKKLQ